MRLWEHGKETMKYKLYKIWETVLLLQHELLFTAWITIYNPKIMRLSVNCDEFSSPQVKLKCDTVTDNRKSLEIFRVYLKTGQNL